MPSHIRCGGRVSRGLGWYWPGLSLVLETKNHCPVLGPHSPAPPYAGAVAASSRCARTRGDDGWCAMSVCRAHPTILTLLPRPAPPLAQLVRRCSGGVHGGGARRRLRAAAAYAACLVSIDNCIHKY
jgi:hypothetical protein